MKGFFKFIILAITSPVWLPVLIVYKVFKFLYAEVSKLVAWVWGVVSSVGLFILENKTPIVKTILMAIF